MAAMAATAGWQGCWCCCCPGTAAAGLLPRDSRHSCLATKRFLLGLLLLVFFSLGLALAAAGAAAQGRLET